MINIRTLKKIENGGGLTLKNGKPITYKTGYQVATEGYELATMQEAMKAIKGYGGSCGVWFENGVWYIDKSRRISTKHEALDVGRAHDQISILNWRTMGLVYCQSLFSMPYVQIHPHIWTYDVQLYLDVWVSKLHKKLFYFWLFLR